MSARVVVVVDVTRLRTCRREASREKQVAMQRIDQLISQRNNIFDCLGAFRLFIKPMELSSVIIILTIHFILNIQVFLVELTFFSSRHFFTLCSHRDIL